MDQFALAVIGSGSGNAVIPEHIDGYKVALIEANAFGGTCINRGCIPTKMFVYTADVAMQIRRSEAFGLTATLEAVDWLPIRDRSSRGDIAGGAQRAGCVEGRHRLRRARPLRWSE